MSEHIVVIGAGAVGCLTALELVHRGWQVTLLDRGRLGGEASWAGGGILFPLLPWHYAEPVNRLALAGTMQYPALCAELYDATGIDPEFQACGMLALADYGGDAALQWCASHAVPAQRQNDALWLPKVGQVRNPRLLKALRARLLTLGVHLLEHCELAPLQAPGSRIVGWESTHGKRIEAAAYVLTAGAWSRSLLGPHALWLEHKPIRGQMLLYKLAAPVLSHILYQEDFYLVQRRDGLLLAGSTMEDVGFDKSTTPEAAAYLHARATKLLPVLRDFSPVMHWSGLRPGAPDNLPVIARHPAFDNLYLNTGHFRYGVTMAPASAEILARLVGGVLPPPDSCTYPYPASGQQKPLIQQDKGRNVEETTLREDEA